MCENFILEELVCQENTINSRYMEYLINKTVALKPSFTEKLKLS